MDSKEKDWDFLIESDASIRAQEMHVFMPGQMILEEGTICEYFMVILSGEVQLQCRSKLLGLLREHDIMGLEYLMFQRPSQVSAQALTECRIACYGAQTLHHILRTNVRMSEHILRSVLWQLMQTKQWIVESPEVYSVGDVQVRFFDDGETIVREGTKEPMFFRLVSSERGLEVSQAGKEPYTIQKPGTIFGEMAVLLGEPQGATVSSLGKSVVQIYHRQQLDDILEEQPAAAVELIHRLLERLPAAQGESF